MMPDQETLQSLFSSVGLVECEYQNLTNGVVAIHKGVKPREAA